ncbi:MAG: 50S ribosomal protein L17 [Dehalococcoidia bacterium]|nr:50S ribosomal protein L17 [Dehalococcoidia bacterium]
MAGRHLGRETSHRLSLYRNLVTDLLRYERITTTEAKAKEIRPMAERIITLGRKGDLHSRRQALRFVYDPKVVKKVFDVIGPRMATRPGGYLRITGLEPRKGDGARMATIELVDVVDAPPTPRPQRVTAAPSARAAAAAPVVEAPKVEEAEEVVEETAAEVTEATSAEVAAEEITAAAEPAAGTATEEPAAESEEDKGAEA